MNIIRKIRKAYLERWDKPSVQRPPYSHIVQIGDPILRIKAENVILKNVHSEDIQKVIGKLKGSVIRNDLYGLSAPQIGMPLRIFVMHVADDPNMSEVEIKNTGLSPLRIQAWLNPEMEILDHTLLVHNEMCGSVVGYEAKVRRYRKVLLRGFNDFGERISMEASNWAARVIQHEMDHLNGILYTDIMNQRTLSSTCWREVNLFAGNIRLRYISNPQKFYR